MIKSKSILCMYHDKKYAWWKRNFISLPWWIYFLWMYDLPFASLCFVSYGFMISLLCNYILPLCAYNFLSWFFFFGKFMYSGSAFMLWPLVGLLSGALGLYFRSCEFLCWRIGLKPGGFMISPLIYGRLFCSNPNSKHRSRKIAQGMCHWFTKSFKRD
jgi:hypothetical protein